MCGSKHPDILNILGLCYSRHSSNQAISSLSLVNLKRWIKLVVLSCEKSIQPLTFNYILESQVHELKPKPGDHQHQDHIGKAEAKPGGKVDNTAIGWKQSSAREKRGSREKSRERTTEVGRGNRRVYWTLPMLFHNPNAEPWRTLCLCWSITLLYSFTEPRRTLDKPHD